MPETSRERRGAPAPEETVVIEEQPAPVAEETVVVDEAVPPGPPMPPAPYEEPPPNRELWPWLLVLLGLVLAGIAAAYFATNHKKKHRAQPATTAAVTTAPAQTVAPLPQTKPAPQVVEASVPKVTGLQAPDALKALEKVGLVGTTKGAFSDKPKSEVLAQDPVPTTKVKKGSTVTLTVSKGKQSVPVPDVVGQDAAAAIETLKAAGFTVNLVRVPNDQPAGQVVAQAPPAGKAAAGSSAVRLNLSDGKGATAPTTTAAATTTQQQTTTQAATTSKPAVPAGVTVPDVTGLKLLAARKKVREAGLVTGFKRVPSTEPKGTVLAQSPKPGATLKRGQHVFVTVSLGPKQTAPAAGQQPTVPDVTGEDEATARADLEAAGFTVNVVDQPSDDPNYNGIVVDQDPAPGGTAAAKSQVTIYVSRSQSG